MFIIIQQICGCHSAYLLGNYAHGFFDYLIATIIVAGKFGWGESLANDSSSIWRNKVW